MGILAFRNPVQNNTKIAMGGRGAVVACKKPICFSLSFTLFTLLLQRWNTAHINSSNNNYNYTLFRAHLFFSHCTNDDNNNNNEPKLATCFLLRFAVFLFFRLLRNNPSFLKSGKENFADAKPRPFRNSASWTTGMAMTILSFHFL